MARSRQILTNFRVGVLSPSMKGLVTDEIYTSGLEIGRNIVVETMGGIKRRAGTRFIDDYGELTHSRLFPFAFNRDQTYVIALKLTGATAHFDIYRDGALVAPDITVPYDTKAKIDALDFAQSADSMILTESGTAPQILRRLGDDASWELVTAPITNPPQDDSSSDQWSDTNGWPQVCTFHQGRLWFAGSNSYPQSVWSSVSQDFFNFDMAGGEADKSIQETLDTDFINPILSIHSARRLQVFTRGGEFTNDAGVLTPTTSYWVRQSDYGSTANVRPLTVDGGTLFVDSTGRTVRNFVYADERGGYDAPSISAAAEHLIKEPTRMGTLRGGEQEPSNFVYVINSDGTMAVLNVSKAHGLLAWTDWTTQGKYVDVVTVDRDVYILVKRVVNGEANPTTRWMLEKIDESMYVDSGVTYDNITPLDTELPPPNDDNFFGIYSDVTDRGHVVVVVGGVMVYKSVELKDDPLQLVANVEGTEYTPRDVFSYNDDVRELYFDEELGYQWYMHSVKSVVTIDSGRNFIEDLAHLLGNEVVSSLDGNIPNPRVVQLAAGETTVESSYPEGAGWKYDGFNVIEKQYVDHVLRETRVTYGGTTYINPTLTAYGYLIHGTVGAVGSIYIQEGAVADDVSTSYHPETFTSSGTFRTAPFETSLVICMVGGGGGGNVVKYGHGTSLGGYPGNYRLVNAVNEFTGDSDVSVTIGAGGSRLTGAYPVGHSGAPTSVGHYMVTGGSGGDRNGPAGGGWSGDGALVSGDTCYGDWRDGYHSDYAYGGGGSIFADGGNGRIMNSGNDGKWGSGGGGTTWTSSSNGSKGGDGKVVIAHRVNNSRLESRRVRRMVRVSVVGVGGAVTYDETFEHGQVGLFYPVMAKTMPLNVNAGAGALVNEPKRIVSVTSRYADTQGVSVNGVQIPEREFGQEVLGIAPRLLTGIAKNRHLGYNRETSVLITQNDPMPFTLLSLDIEVNY